MLRWTAAVLAAARSEIEACGVLLGPPGGRATTCVALPNTAADPRREFVVDDMALLAALRRADADGAVVVALWHSHVDGDAAPSAADDRGMRFADGSPRFPGALLVVVGAGHRVRAWRLRAGAGVDEVDTAVV